MKNKSPIILNCFSRGGSNILWNLFLSHPNVCHPLEETIQIFNTSLRAPRFAGYKINFMTRQNLFNQWNLKDRRTIGKKSSEYIDNVLFNKKLNNVFDKDMQYKDSLNKYSLDEIRNTRLVIKNNNGLIFCSEVFNHIYPDATFVALIRNPIALYESHKRRKTPVSNSINFFIDFYKKMIAKMKIDQDSIANYHIIRFEDIINNPIRMIKTIYKWAHLDFESVDKIRLKSKASMNKKGVRTTKFTENKHYWFSLSELETIINKNVNENQISRLDNQEIDYLLKDLEPLVSEFGYTIG
tara:strand:+ start:149 stop:1039 length:891 start_codon:yes stop_codon:yes gene_type:complete